MKFLFGIFLLVNCLVFVYCASILDFLDAEARDEEEPSKNCLCNGPSCMCCVDFNISLIDLGGPGCVQLNYLSADEGVKLNVSYGENLLHTDTVKGPDPAPTCLKVFTKLAQMCARFTELLPTDDGLRGCIRLEPMLLGEVELEIPLGCFRMGPDGMKMIESSNDVIKEQEPADESAEKVEEPPVEPVKASAPTSSPASSVASGPAEEEEEDDDTIAGFNTKDIIAAVNKSAEEGIALLSNWLGLAVNKTNKSNATVISTSDETAESKESPASIKSIPEKEKISTE